MKFTTRFYKNINCFILYWAHKEDAQPAIRYASGGPTDSCKATV